MSQLIFWTFTLTVAVAAAFPTSNWIQFKDKHAKEYQTPLEESLRASIFETNKQIVEQFNQKHAPERGFRLELNHLADRTSDELKRLSGLRLTGGEGLLLGGNSYYNNTPEASKFLKTILEDNSPVPDELDWRKLGNRVTEVKDQGSECGSCWSFASTGVLEGQEVLRGGRNTSGLAFKLKPLSEQNLIDCSKENNGCQGGLMASALDFVHRQGGLQDEASYPYEGHQNSQCRFRPSKSVLVDSGAAILYGEDEEALKRLVARYGPVSVGIVDENYDFVFYKSGVYFHENCGSKLGHAMLIVGYGTDPKQGDFWLLKNSWGTKWGEAGYIRMARNRGNNCGIATIPTIATFSSPRNDSY